MDIELFDDTFAKIIGKVIGVHPATKLGLDIPLSTLNITDLDDFYFDDLWRYIQQYEADIYIDIYIASGKDYIPYKIKEDVIFHETQIFNSKLDNN